MGGLSFFWGLVSMDWNWDAERRMPNAERAWLAFDTFEPLPFLTLYDARTFLCLLCCVVILGLEFWNCK